MKIKIDKIVINDVLYDVVDGGTSCKDCAIRNLCMINGFADTLAYTRVGSQGNAKVYDFIINPVESNEINRVVTTQEEASELYLKYMAIAAIVISALLCILVIMGMLMKSKTLDEQ